AGDAHCWWSSYSLRSCISLAAISVATTSRTSSRNCRAKRFVRSRCIFPVNLSDSVRAVTEASGDGPIDWRAVTDAAKSATEPGDLSLSETTRAGYASDVRDARTRIQEVADVEFDLPDAIEVQNRHHWID